MPECRPQRGAFETWILCRGVEIGAFTWRRRDRMQGASIAKAQKT